MEYSLWQNVLLVLIGFVILILVSRQAGGFLRLLGRLLINCFLGLAAIVLINSVALWTGLALPINALTVSASSLLGLPGVAALAALKLLA